MKHNRLNQNVFSNVDITNLISEMTGLDTSLDLCSELQAAGLSFTVADDIDSKMIGLFYEGLSSAFLAGYMVGRNPDILILGTFGLNPMEPREE